SWAEAASTRKQVLRRVAAHSPTNLMTFLHFFSLRAKDQSFAPADGHASTPCAPPVRGISSMHGIDNRTVVQQICPLASMTPFEPILSKDQGPTEALCQQRS